MPQLLAYFSVGFSISFPESSSPRITPIVSNPNSLPVAATAAMWLEYAPPKDSSFLKPKFFASLTLYFNFLYLLPDIFS